MPFQRSKPPCIPARPRVSPRLACKKRPIVWIPIPLRTIIDWGLERIGEPCAFQVAPAKDIRPAARSVFRSDGEVAEWLKAPVSKTGIRATVSGVRIPPSPPFLILTRWTRSGSGGTCAGSPCSQALRAGNGLARDRLHRHYFAHANLTSFEGSARAAFRPVAPSRSWLRVRTSSASAAGPGLSEP